MLLKPSQMNRLYDDMATSVMYDLARKELPQQHVFLLVPVAVFVSLCHFSCQPIPEGLPHRGANQK